MCASNLFDNYYFIKNQTKYLTVFVVKSVKKTRNSSAFFLNKINRARLGPKTPRQDFL
jgi:hypothetical protein